MSSKKMYDIIGIGIGPFNLGLAALCHDIPELNCLFIDKTESFNWHTGLMIPGAHLQVPFYADLVTLADPCSKFSYMSFLKATSRLLRFGIHENYFITRKEYNDYCRWVAAQLASLQFNCDCKAIQYNEKEKTYSIISGSDTWHTRHLVIGTGSVPYIPAFAKAHLAVDCFHSADYLFHKQEVLQKKSVTVIGSGQSAAEIFYDLLQHRHQFTKGLHWFTRSERFYPMDYSKFALEMSTPGYIDHFYSLKPSIKEHVLSRQGTLYKGINFSLIDKIYDTLYEQDTAAFTNPVSLHTNAELTSVSHEDNLIRLTFLHKELNQSFEQLTGSVILATGYHNPGNPLLKMIRDRVQWNEHSYHVNRNYSIDSNNQVFVQNAETHTHGFNAADLGLGPYRNAVILNTILGYEHYKTESGVTFQKFGVPV